MKNFRFLKMYFPFFTGPLTCNGILVGITSNGVECALPNYPGIYIDVNQYKNWIYENGSMKNSVNIFGIISMTVLAIFHYKL